MPSAKDLLQDHHQRLEALEAEVALLKRTADEEDIDLPLTAGLGSLAPHPGVTPQEEAFAPPAPPLERALRWDGSTLVIPDPSPEQTVLREHLLPRLGFEHMAADRDMEQADIEAAWMRGGMWWLYHFDQEWVKGMPADVKPLLVRDAELGDEVESEWLARDVLKEDGIGHSASVTTDQLIKEALA